MTKLLLSKTIFSAFIFCFISINANAKNCMNIPNKTTCEAKNCVWHEPDKTPHCHINHLYMHGRRDHDQCFGKSEEHCKWMKETCTWGPVDYSYCEEKPR